MTGFSSILLTALQETLDESLKFAKEVGESFGEILIDMRAVSREPSKRLRSNFECTLCSSLSSVDDERHDFLANFARDAHTKGLKGEKIAKMGWCESDIAYDRCMLCSPDECDYSIEVCVLFQNSQHNREICEHVIEQIGFLAG